MMPNVKIVLVDDHELVRSGFRSLLDNTSDYEVLAEFGNGNDLLRFLETQKPDVALLDIAMPGLNGIETTERVVQLYPDIHIIILSMHAIEEYVIRALSVGAHGYLLKSASPDQFHTAIRTVVAGERYLDPGVSKTIIDQVLQQAKKEPAKPGAKHSVKSLTDRQRQVLQQIAEGKSTTQIARHLQISAKTVGSHRQNLMERLGIYNIADLTKYAIKIGIIETNR